MHKLLLRISSLILAVLTIALFSGSAALAAKPRPASSAPTPLGNDISWPQCNKTLPKGQTFGVVGVNGGLANNTNPCLSTQLAWAAQSTGASGQPPVALYVNTANPGLTGSWWPKSNTYASANVTNPYGTCSGGDDAACAYMYGYAKADDDATIRGINNPAGYRWWLDVETINSWETNKLANAADLEGMTAYFQSIGASVGLYSTGYQWGQIAGRVSSTSNLTNLKSWLPGARSAATAKSNCAAAPLTTGSPVTLTQYVSGSLDYDYACL